MASSFVTGFCCLTLLFVVSVVLVLGVKYTFSALSKLFSEDESANTTPVQKVRRRRRKKAPVNPPQPLAVRSIEINPEEIDRIYVKKVG